MRKPVYSPDGRLIAASDISTTKVWEISTGKLLHKLGAQTDDEAFAFFTRDGGWISIYDGTYRFWDLKSGKFLYRTLDCQDKSWLTLSQDGRYDSSEGAHPRHGHFALRTATGAKGLQFGEVIGTRYYVLNLADRINRGTYALGTDSPLSMVQTSTATRFRTAVPSTRARIP